MNEKRTGTAPTREQILAEPAGPTLDGWVAMHVMEWEHVDNDYCIPANPDDPFHKAHHNPAGLVPFPGGRALGTPSQVKWNDLLRECGASSVGDYWVDSQARKVIPFEDWKPSADIAAAWEVVGKLGRHVALLIEPQDMTMIAVNQTIHRKGRVRCSIIGMVTPPALWADTAPLAVCRAALLAIVEADHA